MFISERKTTVACTFTCIVFLICSGLICYQVSFSDKTEHKHYSVAFSDKSKVYDGDTILDVAVRLWTFDKFETDVEVLWPGVVLKGDSLYMMTDIRIAGIDTPEMRPRKAGRTRASLEKEKSAAVAARQALLDILKKHAYTFTLSNPQIGKYAGRIVAEVHVGPARQSVSELLIQMGHAKPYQGGKKPQWQW